MFCTIFETGCDYIPFQASSDVRFRGFMRSTAQVADGVAEIIVLVITVLHGHKCIHIIRKRRKGNRCWMRSFGFDFKVI